MLERASGYDRAGLIPRLGDPVPARTVDFVHRMLDRRRTGEPLQYVLGIWSFRRLELVVDRRVLIPRPETETVVEVALAELWRLEVRRSAARSGGRPGHASRSGGRSGPGQGDGT